MSDDNFMRNTDAPISPECETVDARLADYLDDAPDPALVAEVDAHVADCPRCAALVADLTGITAAARRLPELRPARDLWAGVAERIDAAAPAVVPIATARRAARGYGMPARWLAAAAAALVIVTAGVTYEVTKIATRGSASASRVAATDNTTNHPTGVTGPAAPPKELVVKTPDSSTSTATTVAPLTNSANPSGVSPVANTGKRTTLVAKSSYDVEIDRLRSIVRQRRADLDPATIAVLDRNLKVIDEAIAQSRAALAHDPRSRFLDEQLDKALDKKIELLRTAALLPART
jgi:hypothetical protein